MTKIPETAAEFNADMLRLYCDIGEGKINLVAAKEKNNAARNIIKHAVARMEHATARHEIPNVPLLK